MRVTKLLVVCALVACLITIYGIQQSESKLLLMKKVFKKLLLFPRKQVLFTVPFPLIVPIPILRVSAISSHSSIALFVNWQCSSAENTKDHL